MGNITQVHFKDGQECCYNITGLEQWDKGQKLEISGLDVDECVEVHFSLQQYCGTAKRMLGKVGDGIIRADIPALILEGPECLYSDTGVYYAYAWLYVSDEESAETIRKMEFVIKARAKPDDYAVPEDKDVIQELKEDIESKVSKSGHAPDKVLATDAEGNVITKDGIEVDSKLSATSKNPIQNKVATEELNKKVNKNHAEITDSLSMGRKAGTKVGTRSTALGTDNTVEAENSMAVGKNNTIKSGAYCSAAVGEGNTLGTNARDNFITGVRNTVNNSTWYNFMSGNGNSVNADYTFTSGSSNSVNGNYSFTSGNGNINNGYAASVSGDSNRNYGSYADIQGYNNTNHGSKVYINGEQNTCNSGVSNVMIVGRLNTLEGGATGAICFGYKGVISTLWSTILSGQNNILRGNNGAISGVYNRLYGHCGFISGHSNIIGDASSPDNRTNVKMCHAQNGSNRITNGNFSHIQGFQNIGQGECQDTIGRFNSPLGNDYAHVVGNGSAATDTEPEVRSNAHTLDWKGNAWYLGSVTSNGADYAEFFEWLDGNPDNEDRVGLIVTLDGEKIKLANAGDEILGIISGTAAVLGDNYECDWNGKYLTDEFGRVIYDEVEEFAEFSEVVFDEVVNEETGETELVERENKYTAPIGTFKRPRVNSDYDPEQVYVNRANRAEWDTVGMVGKLYLRDDGSCEINKYATVGVDGVATTCSERTNMRVLSRVSENVVRVLLK